MTLFHVKCRALDEFDEGVRHRISNVAIFRNNQLQGMVFVTFWGWLSNLQLGDKTVTLNHLVVQSFLRESVSGYVVLQPSVLAKRFLLRFMVANLTQEIMDNKNHKGRHHPVLLLFFFASGYDEAQGLQHCTSCLTVLVFECFLLLWVSRDGMSI